MAFEDTRLVKYVNSYRLDDVTDRYIVEFCHLSYPDDWELYAHTNEHWRALNAAIHLSTMIQAVRMIDSEMMSIMYPKNYFSEDEIMFDTMRFVGLWRDDERIAVARYIGSGSHRKLDNGVILNMAYYRSVHEMAMEEWNRQNNWSPK